VADLPHERSLVDKLATKPFALVGVSIDTPGPDYTKLCQDRGVTWRSFMDCSQFGPINTAWNIHRLPTIFVLDPRGVIRFRDVRGEKMDKAVEALLAEMETRAPEAPKKEGL
jgi:hypothetical protein